MEVQKLRSKSSRPSTDILYKRYLDILALVQTRVLAQYDPLKKKLKAWEGRFFLENNQRVPDKEDMLNDGEAYSTYKKLKLCKQLLAHWKMKFL